MVEFYKLNILGTQRELPILPTPSGVKIAGFNCVGDTEIINKSASELLNQIESQKIDFDIILTTELKGIPIAQEIARLTNLNYVCLRKQPKCYMLEPQKITSESITSGKTEFYVSKNELEMLSNKKVIFVDDVFSTGSTFKGMLNFSKQANFNIVAGAFILKEVSKSDINSPLTFEFEGVKILTCGILPLP